MGSDRWLNYSASEETQLVVTDSTNTEPSRTLPVTTESATITTISTSSTPGVTMPDTGSVAISNMPLSVATENMQRAEDSASAFEN